MFSEVISSNESEKLDEVEEKVTSHQNTTHSSFAHLASTLVSVQRCV